MNKKLKTHFEEHGLIPKINKENRIWVENGKIFESREALRNYRMLRLQGLSSDKAYHTTVLLFGEEAV